MYKKKECVAMLLAGGQGSRLYALTEKTAKPAVPFGGKYRIIDFPLSNCVNSGIDTVGVLTQYQPLVLNEYIGNGQPWDLDRNFGGVMVLPPYQGKHGAAWYKGTANAIYQNLNFIRRYQPEYVLILSGDHIYKMDYSQMLAAHKAAGADATIAVLNVPLSEASRFGIMNTHADGSIYEFEEKPKKPKSTKASMGIYIFNFSVLEQYLLADEADPQSENDFGKNIIPAMLASGKKLFAYEFSGYWKDVGTIQSLWDANMDLLGENPKFRVSSQDWRIYSRNDAKPPQFLSDTADVTNSIVTEGCEIYGTVRNSILFGSVIVEKGACVEDSVIMSHVRIGSGSTVQYAMLDEDTVLGKHVKCGAGKDAPDAAITVVGGDLRIPDGATVKVGAMLTEQTFAEQLTLAPAKQED